jgi:hypothetical protein
VCLPLPVVVAVEVGGSFGGGLAETGKDWSVVASFHVVLAGVDLSDHAALLCCSFEGEDAIGPPWHPCATVLVVVRV